MVNNDVYLDVINKIKETQRMLVPHLQFSQDFIYANIQLQMAIRLIEDGMAQLNDEANGAMTVVFTPAR